MKYTAQQKRIRRHARIRSRVFGTAARPRLSVSRSNKYIYAQLVDDERAITILGIHDRSTKGTKMERATQLGKALAEKAHAQGITEAVFDRGGFRFAGRVRAVAEGARAAGLKF